jgi:deoxycytidylate deaminase
MNALINCMDASKIATCYTNYAPCLQCTKTLLNTSCQRIVYHEIKIEQAAKKLWLSAGRSWEENM